MSLLSPAQSPSDSQDRKTDIRHLLTLLCITWAFALLVRDPFITDWDAYDYAAAVVQGVPSALGLGRALFLAFNRALWLLAHHGFGLLPEDAHLIIRYTVIIQSGPAAAGLYALYRELTTDRRGAFLGALLVTLSPLFIVYSGRGMSEIPGLLLWSWSLWWMLSSSRARRTVQYLLAAALFGLSANMREYAVFYLPVVFVAGWVWTRRWKPSLAALVIAGLTALAGPIFWAIYWPEYYLPAVRSWYSLSAQERLEHPVTLRNLWFLLAYAFICSPVATMVLPAAVRKAWRKLRGAESRPAQKLLLMFALCGLGSIVILPFNHDLAINPRYLLTGLAGVAPLCGIWLAAWIRQDHPRRGAILTALALVTLLGLSGMFVYLHRVQWPLTYASRNYAARLLNLPDNAVFIVGRRTPLVDYYRSIGARPRWHTVPFGAGWPDEGIREVIDSHLREARAVYVDFDESLWFEGMRDHSREAAGLAIIREDYHLEPAGETLYRLAGRRR